MISSDWIVKNLPGSSNLLLYSASVNRLWFDLAMSSTPDTIVAAATPPGTGGIGIVRVSGEKTELIARTLLGSLPEPRSATYRVFQNGAGDKIDAGLALYFPAPTSFTGESVLELHGHGGRVVVA